MNEKKEKKFFTSSGIEVPAFLLKTSLQNPEPGAFPFTRGVHKTMYRSKHWTMRQYAGFGDAASSNERYQSLLKSGGTGLSVAFDLPTQMGYDSDHPFAASEIGRTGVAISSMDDMRVLVKNVPLDKISISMTINSTASILLSMLLVVAKEQGVAFNQLRGTIQNDLLKEYIARGTYIYPIEPSMRIITDIFEFCSENVPHWNTISVSGYHIREAGSTAVQELAFTIADGLTYVALAKEKGLKINEFLPRISFFFNSHNNFFEEIAKFRAARKLWADLIRARYPDASDESCKLRFHTQTGGSTLTAQQPDNNVIRVAFQALSAVLGGTQSLHTNGKDEALSLPTEENAKIALRTQQIIAFETGVADTVDPLAGSYFVEDLTSKVYNEALSIIKDLESRGGVISSIEDGYIQRAISESSYQYQKKVESKEQIIVGVNQFQSDSKTKINIHHLDPKTKEGQLKRLSEYKKLRNFEDTKKSLSELKIKAQSKDNLLPSIISALENKATLGEISDVLRDVFGTFKPKY